MNSIGFTGYAFTIFIVTGILLLLTDAKAYKNTGFQKERKVALILGWVNLSVGMLVMLTNWIYKTWLW